MAEVWGLISLPVRRADSRSSRLGARHGTRGERAARGGTRTPASARELRRRRDRDRAAGRARRTGAKPKQLFQPLRVAITGGRVSPGFSSRSPCSARRPASPDRDCARRPAASLSAASPALKPDTRSADVLWGDRRLGLPATHQAVGMPARTNTNGNASSASKASPRARGGGGHRLASAFAAVEGLPALAESRRKLVALARPSPASDEIAETIEADPALAAAVMRAANGPWPRPRLRLRGPAGGGGADAVRSRSGDHRGPRPTSCSNRATAGAGCPRAFAATRWRPGGQPSRSESWSGCRPGRALAGRAPARHRQAGARPAASLLQPARGPERAQPDGRLRASGASSDRPRARRRGADAALGISRTGSRARSSAIIPTMRGNAAAVRLADMVAHHGAGGMVVPARSRRQRTNSDSSAGSCMRFFYEYPYARLSAGAAASPARFRAGSWTRCVDSPAARSTRRSPARCRSRPAPCARTCTTSTARSAPSTGLRQCSSPETAAGFRPTRSVPGAARSRPHAARSRASMRARIALVCVRTVSALRPSACAICAVARPSATSCRIWRWRLVSIGLLRERTWGVAAGSMKVSDSAAASTALLSSLAGELLATKARHRPHRLRRD